MEGERGPETAVRGGAEGGRKQNGDALGDDARIERFLAKLTKGHRLER